MAVNALKQLTELGQSVWYDNISRDMIADGTLKSLIENYSVRGLTSNPSIFNMAIGGSAIYDNQIKSARKNGLDTNHIFEQLAVKDIGDAADIMAPIFKSSEGNDGFVSIEVSPLLAHDTKESVVEAKRLHSALSRPNIMIKIPGTQNGLPAVRELLEEGINVNITLLFSVENYRQVAITYCEALEARIKKGLPVDKVRSVASFFVSRVDSAIDAKLQKIIDGADAARGKRAKELLGQFGIANSKLAYLAFKEIFHGDRFKALREKGASVQRPLWASTSTKNPNYRDVMYVETLIGPETVNTMPHATLEAFADHGIATLTLDKMVAEAKAVKDSLEDLDIDTHKVLQDLQVDGVKKFEESFLAIGETISKKIAE